MLDEALVYSSAKRCQLAWVQAVREGEKEMASMVELRRLQDCSVRLAWPYSEADRQALNTGRGARAGSDPDSAASDYLLCFLPARLADSPSAVMTADEARATKSKCMQVPRLP